MLQAITLIAFVISLCNLRLFLVLSPKRDDNRTMDFVGDVTLLVLTTGMLLDAYIKLPTLLVIFIAFGCICSFVGQLVYRAKTFPH